MRTGSMRKLISTILTAAIALTVAGCARDAMLPASYEDLLFDTGRVHEIAISLSEEDWGDLVLNPGDKTKYEADITIDGESIQDVAFATKGNSTLQFVANHEGSDRYSFKITFDKYVEGQTYHGLHRLHLLNLYGDATYMKDYISYSMFRRAGVPAPLASYVWLKVNGNVQGLYLAVEDVGESFIERCLGGTGSLYKPENSFLSLDEDGAERLQDNACVYVDGSNGSDLVYRGDEEDLYTDIFENDVCIEDAGSHTRVIEAMRCITEDHDLEEHLYTDETISYFAVHNFLVNYDSYTGRMLHNYYIYENDGRLMMLPWDYDLIFGGFPEDGIISHVSDPVRVVNMGIDSPLNDTTNEERPMWSWIVQNESYLAKYHEVMDMFISSYFESGEFEAETEAVYELILPYVEQDPTAFYSTEAFHEAYDLYREISLLRAGSIRLQLNGELSSVTDDQSDEDRIDAAYIDVSILKGAGSSQETKESEDTEMTDMIRVETVQTEEFAMDYFKFGHGDRTLVIIPGLSVQSVMGSANQVAQAYESLTDEFTVYLFDRRSDLPDTYSIADMARDTSEAIESLGLGQVYLFGTSQGGMIAMQIAIDHPDQVTRLVLGSSSAAVGGNEYRTINSWTTLAEEKNAEGLYLAFGEAVYPHDVFEQSKDLLIQMAATVTSEDLDRFVILANGINGFDILDDLDRITCPVLVLGSNDDQVLGGDASVLIADHLGNQAESELYMYDGYGHGAYDTAPDYKDRILAFLTAGD